MKRLVAALALSACGAAGPPAVAPAEPTAPDEPHALSADQRALVDGINARYRDDADPEHWKARFEAEGREAFDRRADILAALDLREGMAVADIGAGTGLFTMELAQRVGTSGHVFAVDVQPYFVEHVRARATSAGHEHVEAVLADESDVRLPEASIDLALLCDVYHHLPDPHATMRSVHRALRPGGRLAVIDYRRIEGESEPWLLGHVRAAPEVFRAEIEAAGFTFDGEMAILRDNFFFVFRRA